MSKFKVGDEVWVKANVSQVNEDGTVDLVIKDDAKLWEYAYSIPNSSIVIEKPTTISGKAKVIYDFDKGEIVEYLPSFEEKKEEERYKVIGVDAVGIEHTYSAFVTKEMAKGIVNRYSKEVGRGKFVVALDNTPVMNLFYKKIGRKGE